MQTTASNYTAIAPFTPNDSVEDYAEVLRYHGAQFKKVDFYLQVGEIAQVQGWMLYITAVRTQIVPLLNVILPTLIQRNTVFKVVQDRSTARMLLDGHAGSAHIGKIVIICPGSDVEAITLAKELTMLTASFKGPVVRAGIHIAGNVYARYGGINPVKRMDASGRVREYIYDQDGKLIVDTFISSLPNGVVWPFATIAPLTVPAKRTVLHRNYRPISILKSDAKGDVYKCVYLKKWVLIGTCVLKQGRAYMWSDDEGNDMSHRMEWQWQLHNELADHLPIPRILDKFVADGDTYLAMEYIKGASLHYHAGILNTECWSWRQLPTRHQHTILGYIMQIIDSLDKLHAKGYVHRDVTPMNFIVGKHNRLYLIDIEMTYSITKKYPLPPFQFGTTGFMSPEQLESSIPTIKEDIFALGATMISLLTGLCPLCFEGQPQEKTAANLQFFIGDHHLAQIITACLHPHPDWRPVLHQIKEVVATSKSKVFSTGKLIDPQLPAASSIKVLIEDAIRSLSCAPTPISDGLWQTRVSRSADDSGAEQVIYAPDFSLSKGLSGVLYLLALAHKAGFSIEDCRELYDNSWEYINNNFLSRLSEVPPGLYTGSSGIAVAVVSGIEAGILEDNAQSRSIIRQCLDFQPAGVDMQTGAAGQGMAVLRCKAYLDEGVLLRLLGVYSSYLLTNKMDKDCWVRLQKGNKYVTSFAFGNTGIIWFLLKYGAAYKNDEVYNASIQLVEELMRQAMGLKRTIKRYGLRTVLDYPALHDGIYGIVLVLILAFEVTKDARYKVLAEEMLLLFPMQIVHDNFSLGNGLAGLGEVYLEAYRVFGDLVWKERADWIAGVFLHAGYYVGDGRCYWVNNNATNPTIELMVGNVGIIHFLICWLDLESKGFGKGMPKTL